MVVTLKAEQEAWIAARVARGDFVSVEDAARQLIAERIAEREVEEDDNLDWARAGVAEGLAALKRSEVISLDELKTRNAKRLTDLAR